MSANDAPVPQDRVTPEPRKPGEGTQRLLLNTELHMSGRDVPLAAGLGLKDGASAKSFLTGNETEILADARHRYIEGTVSLINGKPHLRVSGVGYHYTLKDKPSTRPDTVFWKPAANAMVLDIPLKQENGKWVADISSPEYAKLNTAFGLVDKYGHLHQARDYPPYDFRRSKTVDVSDKPGFFAYPVASVSFSIPYSENDVRSHALAYGHSRQCDAQACNPNLPGFMLAYGAATDAEGWRRDIPALPPGREMIDFRLHYPPDKNTPYGTYMDRRLIGTRLPDGEFLIDTFAEIGAGPGARHEFKRRVPLHLKVKLDEKGLPIFSLDDLGTIERANLELQQLPLDPPPKLEHKQGSSLTGPFPVAAVEASPVQGFAPDTKGLPQLKTLAV